MPNCAAVLSETYQEISHFLCLSLAKVQRLTVIVSQSIMFCCCTAEELGKWQPLCRQTLLLETIRMCIDVQILLTLPGGLFCLFFFAFDYLCNKWECTCAISAIILQICTFRGHGWLDFHAATNVPKLSPLTVCVRVYCEWKRAQTSRVSQLSHTVKKTHHWSAYAWVNSNVLIYVVSSRTLGWHWVSAWWIPRAQSVKSSCGYQDSPDTHSPMINFPSSILWPAFTHQHQSNTSKYSEWLNAFSSPGILQTKMASEGK